MCRIKIKQVMVWMLLAASLLSGCGGQAAAPASTSIAISATSAAATASAASTSVPEPVRAYRKSVGVALGEMGAGLRQVSTLLQKDQRTNAAWFASVQQQAERVRQGHRALVELAAPPEVQTTHAELLGATSQCYLAMGDLTEGLRTSNQVALDKFSQELEDCKAKLRRVDLT